MTSCNRQISSQYFPSRSIAVICTHNKQGFTLIELMLVIIVIGILVVMAIPKLMVMTTRAKDGEARTILAQIYSLETAFKAQHSSYTSDLDSLGYADTGMKYWIGPVFIPVPTDTSFTAVLIEKGDMDGDDKYNNTRWTVTQASREAIISGRS